MRQPMNAEEKTKITLFAEDVIKLQTEIIDLKTVLDVAELEVERLRNSKWEWRKSAKEWQAEFLDQAEENQRLQKLDETNQETITALAKCAEDWKRQYINEWAENQRLRKALEFYADKENLVWLKANDVLIPSGVHNDNGETARQALSGEEK